MKGLIPGLSTVVAALALAPGAHAAGPSLVLGATEDAVRSVTLADAKTQMDLLVLAGFGAVRITQPWTPGTRELSADDQTVLENVATAAQLANVTVLTSVMNPGSRTTPLTPADQADFAGYAAAVVTTVPALRIVIVGNEPNLNRYWLPQFNDDGSDAAAPAYESLLALTYDALKTAAPDVTVLGGALAPRGGDVAGGIRPTHSPTVFIEDMGQAYRDSGRTEPIMDGFAFHPYEDNSSIAPVSGTHPNTATIALADYPKLVTSLAEAFPEGDSLPIWYDEFGVETQIPAAYVPLYAGTEPAATKPDLFHTVDEPDLAGWQSGVYYADGTPKSSVAAVKLALDDSRRGVVAHCDGLELSVQASVAQRGSVLTLTCDLDCAYVAQLYRLPGKLLVTKRGRAIGARPTTLPLRVPKPKASYRLRLSAVAPVNPGPPTLRLVPLRHG